MQAASALLLVTALATSLRAQDASPAPQECYLPRPLPACRLILLTNAGGFLNLDPSTSGESRFRAILDWGLLANTGRHDGVGASFFVMLDEDEFSYGPVLRYRRWFSERRSLDITVGTPVSPGDLRPGSVLGMIKYNPDDWAGFALRPEYALRRDYVCTVACVEETKRFTRVYAGAEVGWYPGLAVSIGSAVMLGIMVILLAGSD